MPDMPDMTEDEAILEVRAWQNEAARLRAFNAELVRIVLEDTDGDLDFVQFKVRALIEEKA